MARTFRVFAALLSYPTEEIQTAAPLFREVLAEDGLLPDRQQTRLGHLIDQIASRDLYDLQERYVQLFDRSKSLSLHLFEHVHGESRDRGQAMVDLQNLYQQHGLEIAARELPDFLPLFLEFLSTLPVNEACELLSEPGHVLAALRDRLRKRKSIYSVVFAALQSLTADSPAASEADIHTPDDDPDDLEALDRAWEDEPVTFGPGEQSCPMADQMVQRMSPTAKTASKTQGA